MPSKDPGQRLQDILDNIEALRRFIDGMDFEAFVADQKTFYAVTRALEIISEASRRLPADVKAAHSSINWELRGHNTHPVTPADPVLCAANRVLCPHNPAVSHKDHWLTRALVE